MSYGNLVDIGLNVDTSELEERLDKIDERLNDLGGEDILDEDAVTRIVEGFDYLPRDDAQDFVSSSDVEQTVRDLMHSEGADFVQTIIDNGSYITEYDLDDKLRELDNTPDEDAVRTIVESLTDGRFHKLEQRFDDEKSIESLAERLDSLTEQVKAQDSAIDVLEARTTGDGELGMALTFFSLLRQAFNALRRD